MAVTEKASKKTVNFAYYVFFFKNDIYAKYTE